MQTIYYNVKNTSASTEYTLIEKQDMEDIRNMLFHISALINEMDRYTEPLAKEINKDLLHKFNTNLPRGKDSMNTIASYVGGLICNIVYGTQKDLSTKQLRALEYITEVASTVWPDKIKQYQFVEE